MGCGGSSGDADGIRTTLQTYLTAIADGDGQRACDQLTKDQARVVISQATAKAPELQAASCADALTKLSGALDADQKRTLRDAKVSNVRINGGSATAEVVGGSQTAELEKSHGRWLISGGLF
jgi:hypothetical protein